MSKEENAKIEVGDDIVVHEYIGPPDICACLDPECPHHAGVPSCPGKAELFCKHSTGVFLSCKACFYSFVVPDFQTTDMIQ